MKLPLRLLAIPLAVLCLALLASPRPASAHPMGNFSINRYSALTVQSDRVDVLYVVDMAEIPAFQELQALGANAPGDLTPESREAYVSRKSAELVKGLSLSTGGKALQLSVERIDLSFPLGNTGLPTLRFKMDLSARLGGAQRGTILYRDGNFADRVGWKEIIARPGDGVGFESSSVPEEDKTRVLTQYNPDALSSAPQATQATIVFVPGVLAASGGQPQIEAPRESERASTLVQGRGDGLTALLARDRLPLEAILFGLVIAFFWGAGHALSPGHGKTVVAAYLVGTRGTALHAAILGLTVTLSHTIGVFALGLVVLYAADYILPDQVYPWLGFVSGFLIVLVGLTLFVQRWRAWRRGDARTRTHTHAHDDHAHTHDHDHHHEHGHEHHDHEHEHGHSHDHTKLHKHGPFSRPHSHVPADERKVTMGSLLALGITGGIIPCPTALVVLLAAVAYHHVAVGLIWIVSFSLGLAAVLTGLGLLVVYGRGLVGRLKVPDVPRGRALLARLPMASALVVACLGFLIAFQSVGFR